MKQARSAGGWASIGYAWSAARRVGGMRRLYNALRSRNTGKTCALGVLIGDSSDDPDDGTFAHLWEWDGIRWNHRADVTGGSQPPNLDRVEMSYDSWRGVMVVRHKPRIAGHQTWEFDGDNWALRSTS